MTYYHDHKLACSSLGRFLKAPETFRARKASFRYSVSRNREVYTPETSCMKRTSAYSKNMWIKQLCNHKVWDFSMALRVRNFSGPSTNAPSWCPRSYLWLVTKKIADSVIVKYQTLVLRYLITVFSHRIYTLNNKLTLWVISSSEETSLLLNFSESSLHFCTWFVKFSSWKQTDKNRMFTHWLHDLDRE